MRVKVDISHLQALSSDEDEDAFNVSLPPPVTRIVNPYNGSRPAASTSTLSSGDASDVDTSQREEEKSLDESKKHKKKKKKDKKQKKIKEEDDDAVKVKTEEDPVVEPAQPEEVKEIKKEKKKKSKKRAKEEEVETAEGESNPNRPMSVTAVRRAHDMSSSFSEDGAEGRAAQDLVGDLGFIDRGAGQERDATRQPPVSSSSPNRSHRDGSLPKKKHKKKSREEKRRQEVKNEDTDSDTSLPALDIDPGDVNTDNISTPTPTHWTEEKRAMIEKRLQRFDNGEKTTPASPTKKRKISPSPSGSPGRKRKREEGRAGSESPVSSPKRVKVETKSASPKNKQTAPAADPLETQTPGKKRLSLSKKKKSLTPKDLSLASSQKVTTVPEVQSPRPNLTSSKTKTMTSPTASVSSIEMTSPFKKTSKKAKASSSVPISPKLQSSVRDGVYHRPAPDDDTSDSGVDEDDEFVRPSGLTATQELFQSQSKRMSTAKLTAAHKHKPLKESKHAVRVGERIDKDSDDSDPESVHDGPAVVASEKFTCPDGFHEVTVRKRNKRWGESVVGPDKQLWLVQVPQQFDLKLLAGKDIMLNGSLAIHREQDPKNKDVTYEWETHATPDENLQNSNMVLVLPSKKSKTLRAVGPFQGRISVTRSEATRPYIVPEETKKTPRLPDNLKYRLSIGSGKQGKHDSSESSSDSIKKKKKKKKDKKRDEAALASDTMAPTVKEELNENEVPSKKKKKKKDKHKESAEEETESKASVDLGESYVANFDPDLAPTKVKKRKKKSENEAGPEVVLDVNHNGVAGTENSPTPPAKKKKKKVKKERE